MQSHPGLGVSEGQTPAGVASLGVWERESFSAKLRFKSSSLPLVRRQGRGHRPRSHCGRRPPRFR